MGLTARQKTALAVVILILGGLGAAFYYFVLPLLAEWDEAEADVRLYESKLKTLRAQFNDYSNPALYLEHLEPLVKEWERDYEKRTKAFTRTLRTVPANVKTPGFYYSEQWRETRARLIEKSERLNIPVPIDNIGFTSAIPAREQVELLLNRMSIAEYVLNMAMDSGVFAVENFAMDAPREEHGFMRIMPIQITIVGPIKAIKTFLLKCGRDPQYMTVKYLSVTSIREVTGEVNFRVQAFLETTWLVLE